MGINSSVNTDPDYTIQKANDGYLYVNGGNITLGTQSTGSDIVFFTDGTLTANEAGRVHLGRWILGGVDNGVDKLQVTGNVTVGNIAATNLTNRFTAITANAVSLQNQITGANAAIVTANTGLKSYVDSQVTTLNTSISGVTTAWQANAAGQANQITGANTNISTNTTAIATLNANVGAYELFANANVASLQNQITGANTNIATGVTNFNTLNANVGAYQIYANANIGTATTNITTLFSNAATQQTQITSLYTNANANTAAYLSNGISTNIVTTGNVTAGNISVNASGTLSTPRVIINDGGLRTVTGGTTLTVDFNTDSRILWYVPTGDTTITLANYTAGAEVEVMIRMGASGRNIALGIAGVNNSTTGATTMVGHGVGALYGANQAVALVYTCFDTTQANCYVRASYV